MGWLRNPRTTQEKRMNIRDHKYTRGVRRNLPSSWDDLFKHRWKSWKKYRRTQYHSAMIQT